ncbi:MAG: hypothetical protein KGI27_12280 [Thaumarchaeota archaeon]|nr:hypothetical protein [Nitrososphaerota archaeon]
MNGWSFSEIKRQIEYKSRWTGIPIIQLSKKDARGTSRLCPDAERDSKTKWHGIHLTITGSSGMTHVRDGRTVT